jgi:hypothetical protein
LLEVSVEVLLERVRVGRRRKKLVGGGIWWDGAVLFQADDDSLLAKPGGAAVLSGGYNNRNRFRFRVLEIIENWKKPCFESWTPR